MPDHWPTEPGWYWVRTRFQTWSEWRVVQVQEQDDEPLFPFLPRPHLDTEWVGPLEPPKVS
jgi:hypothetical protein